MVRFFNRLVFVKRKQAKNNFLYFSMSNYLCTLIFSIRLANGFLGTLEQLMILTDFYKTSILKVPALREEIIITIASL